MRPFHSAVSLALAALLLASPLAAVLCAEWCAPSSHVAGASVHHGAAPAAPHLIGSAASGSADCHGGAGEQSPRLAAHVAPECLDYTLSDHDAAPTTSRWDAAQLMSPAPATGLAVPNLPSLQAEAGSDLAHASPPRPVAASPILRI